jgi:hypothetical protein
MVCVVGFSVEMGVLEGYGGFWRVYGIWWVFYGFWWDFVFVL